MYETILLIDDDASDLKLTKGFLSKPFSEAGLRETVARLTGNDT